ncbi:AAA family ATPase [Clostridium botulinum]|uniref:ParA family protein n=1 Tax=Clostridium botulinum TaxID=1491 RepID=UPI001C9B57EE|nr:AAA family ATPase [Clostridium botulinum]MBY6757027.1 AAA family ATPase [Clostridium botulinum]
MGDIKNIIAFLNMKGGVCKTTLCKEIAYTLTEKLDKKVLVIDIDPQSNCTQAFYEKYNVIEGESVKKYMEIKKDLPSIEKIFTKSPSMINKPKMEDIIYKLSPNLHIMPSSLDTLFMERETSNGNDQTLLNFIKDKNLKTDYNYIFIDCPPTYSFYTISALLAADYYLVPLVPDIYSMLGLNLLNQVVNRLNYSYKAILEYNPIENMGVIFTKVPLDTRITKGMQENIDEIQKEFKDTYFFEQKFQYSGKLANDKIETFIIDRNDTNLVNNITLICHEFIERMDELNGK